MIKYAQHILTKPLTKLFNAILKSGVYPETWAQGYISPIYKTGNPLDPNNYRGVTIGSSLAKVFNTVLNNRLDNYLLENNIIHETQIAFQKNSRTSDHMFILQTLTNSYVKHAKKKLYACFVDFQKAFDSLPHDALLHKLQSTGITGQFLQTIYDMYSKTNLHVKINGKLTPSFPGQVGVRQGDVLSPNLFKIFINDLPELMATSETDPPKLHSKPINCLLYADDLVLLAETREGLQKTLDTLDTYCSDWGLKVNQDKTKVIIFSPHRNKPNETFTIGTHNIDCTQEYKYLGITFTSSGSFDVAQDTLYKKGLKAYFKLIKMLSTEQVNAQTVTHLFDHTVKPIMLYASEIWGTINSDLRRVKNTENNVLEKAYFKLQAEKVHLKMCRYILGVKPKTTITAIQGETGRFPLYLDITYNKLKYLHHLTNTKSDLLQQALASNKQLVEQNKPCWLSWVQIILREAGLNTDVTQTPVHTWLPRAKKTIQLEYKQNWKLRLQTDHTHNKQNNKLRTYRTFKTCFQEEPYLNILTDRELRRGYARLRTSSHTLHIETGRFVKTPPQLRLCQLCHSGEVEDETHFLINCKLYTDDRDHLFANINNTCPNFTTLSPPNKMIWLLSADHPDIVLPVAKFIRKSVKIRENSLRNPQENV
jgi:hypothetical protein